MRIFEKELVKKALSQDLFMDFINKIVPFYDQEIPLSAVALIDWNECQKKLSDFTVYGLNNLKDSSKQPPCAFFPKIIQGVYFCLADDALHFSIHGSFYYNEIDWAANADFDILESTELFSYLGDELTSLQLDSQLITDLLCFFAAFTLLKTLRKITNISDIANAHMCLGFSDGDILVLGYFLNNKFIEHIEIIENGDYQTPSTAPEVVYKPVSARGNLWDYLRSYHKTFLNEHGLFERFIEFGEEEAAKIALAYSASLNLNYCPLCNAIKKTPQARLCLNCGEFTDPVISDYIKS